MDRIPLGDLTNTTSDGTQTPPDLNNRQDVDRNEQKRQRERDRFAAMSDEKRCERNKKRRENISEEKRCEINKKRREMYKKKNSAPVDLDNNMFVQSTVGNTPVEADDHNDWLHRQSDYGVECSHELSDGRINMDESLAQSHITTHHETDGTAPPRIDLDGALDVQDNTVHETGVYLPAPVFSHGQLYVAMSRATARTNIKILALPPDAEATEEEARKIEEKIAKMIVEEKYTTDQIKKKRDQMDKKLNAKKKKMTPTVDGTFTKNIVYKEVLTL